MVKSDIDQERERLGTFKGFIILPAACGENTAHWAVPFREAPESVTGRENCEQAPSLWFLWEEKGEEGQTGSELVSYA